MAAVAGDVLALVEVAVVHVFLHHVLSIGAHDAAALVCIVQDVSVSHVLSMYAASTLDHGKLLSIQILI